MRAFLFLLCCCGILTACVMDESIVDENAVLRDASVEAFPLGEMSGRDSLQLVLTKDLYRIGGGPRSGGPYFAGWLDAVIFDDTVSVVSDRTQHQLFLVSPSGEYSALSRRGSGPGEIQEVSDMFKGFGGGLGILDNRLRRLTVFSISAKAAHPASETPTFGTPTSSCALDSVYVGMSFTSRDSGIFAVYPLNQRPRPAFGRPLVGGSARLNRRLASGALLCLPALSGILASPMTGDLLSFSLDGTLNWRKRIPGFIPGAVVERPGGMFVGLLAEDSLRSRLVVSLLAIDSVHGIVQLQEYVREGSGTESRAQPTTIYTKIFELSTGRLVGSQTGLPRILDVAKGLLLLVEDLDDEPTLRAVGFSMGPVRATLDS